MTQEKFDKIISKQVTRCLDTLTAKSVEYATEDRFHNFTVAAAVQGITKRQALAGMMTKHIVSIYDICMENTRDYSEEYYNEKIGDAINYLLILRALLVEEAGHYDNIIETSRN